MMDQQESRGAGVDRAFKQGAGAHHEIDRLDQGRSRSRRIQQHARL